MVNTGTYCGKVGFASAAIAVAVGAGVLSGWMFDQASLDRVFPELVAMNPATAVGFILAGISLGLFLQFSRGRDPRSRALVFTARLCAFAVAFVGLARLTAMLTGWDLGVDHWLFSSKLANSLDARNHMAPNTAANFLLLGGALLMMDATSRSVRRAVKFAAMIVGLVSLLAVLGYAYGVQPLYRLGPFGAMAMCTAITFSILSVGLLLAHADGGLMATLVGNSTGGKLARLLLPAAVLIPAFIGWLSRLGEEAGYPVAFCDAAETVGNVLVLTILICWSAQKLFQADVRRRKAEAETRKSEKRFSGAFEHAPIGVALVLPGGQLLKVNRALCELLGYTQEELLTRTIQEITHPDDVAASEENVRRMDAGEMRSFQNKKRYVHRDGHLITALVNVSRVRDERGEPSYAIVQVQDITEHERAAAALLESERFLQATLDALSSHIAILDEHGVIIKVNAAWNRFADQNGGQDGRRSTGANYLRVCDAAVARRSEDASAVSCGIRAVMAGQTEEFQLEYPCHSPRERRWFLVCVTRFGGGGGGRVVVAHENITARKQAELARNASQLRYRSLFENMLEGYMRCQVLYEDGRAKDCVYLEVNRTFETLTGLRDVVGRKVSDVVPGAHENNPELLEVFSRVAATGIPERFETYAKKLGIWFSISVYSHEKEHFMALFDNITERKRTEIGLRFDEQRYRSLVEATTAIVWDTPASGEFEVEQPAWTALTGQSFEELRGWGWLKAIHPDDQAETGRVWSAAVESRSMYEVEHRLRTRDGTYRNMMVRAVPVLTEGGTIHQWIGIHTDITERKQADEWRARLAAIIESSEDAIASKDLESNVTSWNAAAEKMFGYSAAEMVGSSIRRLIPQDRQAEEDEIISSIRRGEPMRHIETVRMTKSGRMIDVSVTVSPIKDAAGNVVGASKIVRDITEQKRSESELRWKTAFFEAQVNSSLDGILVVDSHGKKLVQNQQFTDLLKIPKHIADDKEDDKQVLWVTGMTKDPAAFIVKVAHLFSHRDETSRDQIELKDGTVLDRYSAPVCGDDGTYFGRIWTFRDITERTRSEALLLESQQRLALATESAHIGIWDWNVAENKMVWDARMLALYGLRPQDFGGAVEAWQNGLHREDRQRAEAEIAAALAGTRDFQTEFRVVWPGGEVRDIQAHGVVQRAADGSVTRMVGVNWDVTARKRIESRYRRLVESNVQGILFWTATGAITGANDAFLGLTGYTREDLEAGRIDWMAMTPPEYAHLDRRALGEIAAHGASALYEKEFIRKDGSRVPILLGATAFEDNPNEGVCFVLDLSDRKRLETQLVQSQKLETVGKLAGGIAHEFNSILTAIIGQSELLLSDLPSGSPLLSNATEITKAAGRAAALTRQLLAYGRKQLLQPEALDLNRVITRMDGVLRHLMGGEIDTRIVATPGLHAVKADVGQLEQVIMQDGHQCPRCHAGWRQIHAGNRQRFLRSGKREQLPGVEAGRLRDAGHRGYRRRDDYGSKGTPVRAVFLHQARWRGDRFGIVHLLRHHQTKRRPHQRLQRTCPGQPPSKSICRKLRQPKTVPLRRSAPTDLPRGDGNRFCWSRTIPPCAKWRPLC